MKKTGARLVCLFSYSLLLSLTSQSNQYSYSNKHRNAIVKEFKDNDDVVFGDVNLRADPVRRIHDNDIPVGSGGWPFMMYVIVVTRLLNISNEQ